MPLSKNPRIHCDVNTDKKSVDDLLRRLNFMKNEAMIRVFEEEKEGEEKEEEKAGLTTDVV